MYGIEYVRRRKINTDLVKDWMIDEYQQVKMIVLMESFFSTTWERLKVSSLVIFGQVYDFAIYKII